MSCDVTRFLPKLRTMISLLVTYHFHFDACRLDVVAVHDDQVKFTISSSTLRVVLL